MRTLREHVAGMYTSCLEKVMERLEETGSISDEGINTILNAEIYAFTEGFELDKNWPFTTDFDLEFYQDFINNHVKRIPNINLIHSGENQEYSLSR